MPQVRRDTTARVLVVAVAVGYAAWLERPELGTPDLPRSIVYATVGVGLVLTGALLGAEPGQRPNGRLFVAAGLCGCPVRCRRRAAATHRRSVPSGKPPDMTTAARRRPLGA